MALATDLLVIFPDFSVIWNESIFLNVWLQNVFNSFTTEFLKPYHLTAHARLNSEILEKTIPLHIAVFLR